MIISRSTLWAFQGGPAQIASIRAQLPGRCCISPCAIWRSSAAHRRGSAVLGTKQALQAFTIYFDG